MMGWFMIDVSNNNIIVNIADGPSHITIYNSIDEYLEFMPYEIDDLIAALQKAKAIMAIDKSK